MKATAGCSCPEGLGAATNADSVRTMYGSSARTAAAMASVESAGVAVGRCTSCIKWLHWLSGACGWNMPGGIESA